MIHYGTSVTEEGSMHFNETIYYDTTVSLNISNFMGFYREVRCNKCTAFLKKHKLHTQEDVHALHHTKQTSESTRGSELQCLDICFLLTQICIFYWKNCFRK